ncbi:hypothetical protein ACIA47_15995 [Micromonospora sp. NPDC051227]|uniref:hypothetical protein n=1 Tax=Micromonospora sp. NPDC051227 TaxID=3364285 RepID=UPI00379B9713
MIKYQERLPQHLPDAIEALAQAVQQLQRETRTDKPHEQTRRLALRAAEEAGWATGAGLQNFGVTVATQARLAASDLLRATGCQVDEANRRVRQAARSAEQANRQDDGDRQ